MKITNVCPRDFLLNLIDFWPHLWLNKRIKQLCFPPIQLIPYSAFYHLSAVTGNIINTKAFSVLNIPFNINSIKTVQYNRTLHHRQVSQT